MTMLKEASQLSLLKVLDVHFNEKGEKEVSTSWLAEELKWE